MRAIMIILFFHTWLSAVTIDQLIKGNDIEAAQKLAFNIIDKRKKNTEDRVKDHILPFHTIPSHHQTNLFSRFNFILASTHDDSGRPNGGLRKSCFLIPQTVDQEDNSNAILDILLHAIANSDAYHIQQNKNDYSLVFYCELQQTINQQESPLFPSTQAIARALDNAWPWEWDLWVQNNQQRWIDRGVWFSNTEGWTDWLKKNNDCCGLSMGALINNLSSDTEKALGPELGRTARNLDGAKLHWITVVFLLFVEKNASDISLKYSKFITIYPFKKT
ncbi:MAG: hypothetical protein A2Y14_00810 [Verrucomicrobia bacterium GWF2_51_19]|nr:MAG: hypothetical protein A2Y14_00810 [Verrucomicrobia bacterium GWF2_51_19]HAD82593.1 hypothetical protein [Candidatus Edwardsbacteria bacterium]